MEFQTIGEVKKYFRTIRFEQLEIMRMLEMIERKETGLLPRAIVYNKDKVQTSPEDFLAKNEAEIVDLTKLMQEKAAELRKKKMEAEKIVESIECPGERDVMRMYYLSLKKDYRLHRWEEVAAKLGYTMRHTLRLHSDALEKIISR
jgi:hypothetical protein